MVHAVNLGTLNRKNNGVGLFGFTITIELQSRSGYKDTKTQFTATSAKSKH